MIFGFFLVIPEARPPPFLRFAISMKYNVRDKLGRIILRHRTKPKE